MRRHHHALLLVTLVVTATICAAVQASASADCDGRTGPGISCREGLGRTTPGGGAKVSHLGWPAITGIYWSTRPPGHVVGTLRNDELLGGHNSDRLSGGPGRDVLWGDQYDTGNDSWQRDVLRGGAGADFLYPSHGTNTILAGPGDDRVIAYYGHGTIDCGPGYDIAQVRTNGAYRLRNCEHIVHFCAFGSDAQGNCRKPGERRSVTVARAGSAGDEDLCAGREGDGISCRLGRGRTTTGGGGKASHAGWPAITGIYWSTVHSGRVVGTRHSDELLGMHGSDTLDGGAGRDVIWGDMLPTGNDTWQHDVLRGGTGDDFIYASHGANRIDAGPGDDFVKVIFGHGSVNCGPGDDTVEVPRHRRYVLHNCEHVERWRPGVERF